MFDRSHNLNSRKLLAAAVLSTVLPFATNRHAYGVMFKDESDGGAGDDGGKGGGDDGDADKEKDKRGKKGAAGDNSGDSREKKLCASFHDYGFKGGINTSVNYIICQTLPG